ncbi:uncharacterized protein LOC134453947 [Engraulis encrasicolus]|uniref:uncharacterized protein LOC134453947 n=1 Tax=Engraulis encrasicolus TaxID=184585 RepID=UPI002FD5CF0B
MPRDQGTSVMEESMDTYAESSNQPGGAGVVPRGENIILSWTSKRGVTGTWKKKDTLLQHGGRIIISHNDHKEFHLTITGAREEDEGQYTLQLENFWGKESGSAHVKVLEYDSDWRHLNWDPANIEKQNEKQKKKLREFPISNPGVRQLRFLLHGITSYGKSTLINSIMTVFKQRVITLVPAASNSDKTHTKCFKTYMIEDHQNRALPFIFSDTMGVELGEGGVLAADIISALKGHVMDGYEVR